MDTFKMSSLPSVAFLVISPFFPRTKRPSGSTGSREFELVKLMSTGSLGKEDNGRQRRVLEANHQVRNAGKTNEVWHEWSFKFQWRGGSLDISCCAGKARFRKLSSRYLSPSHNLLTLEWRTWELQGKHHQSFGHIGVLKFQSRFVQSSRCEAREKTLLRLRLHSLL